MSRLQIYVGDHLQNGALSLFVLFLQPISYSSLKVQTLDGHQNQIFEVAYCMDNFIYFKGGKKKQTETQGTDGREGIGISLPNLAYFSEQLPFSRLGTFIFKPVFKDHIIQHLFCQLNWKQNFTHRKRVKRNTAHYVQNIIIHFAV